MEKYISKVINGEELYYLKDSEARANLIDKSEKGAVSGVATLDETGKVPSEQLPELTNCVIEGYYVNGIFYIDKPAVNYVKIGNLYWATQNVGSDSITDPGLYFQWGDSQGYTIDQIGSGEGQKYFYSDFRDYKYSNEDGSVMTKYNTTDGKTVLDAEDDAATVNIGSGWRMPTTEEYFELGRAVTITWVSNYEGSGTSGLVCTDKNDSSNILFFPAGGSCSNGNVTNIHNYGNYWSSSLSTNSSYSASIMSCYNNGVTWQTFPPRCIGFLIRGVSDTEPIISGEQIVPETGKIYTDLYTNRIYRWNGVEYIEVSPTRPSDWNATDGDTQILNKPTIPKAVAVKGNAETSYRTGNVNITPANIGLGNITNDAQVKRSEMGVSNGVATLDSNGKVPSSQLNSCIVEGVYRSGRFYRKTQYTPDYVKIGDLYWAKTNVGADTESDLGLYFQWGDIQGYTADQCGSGEGQKYFGWKDYKYCNGSQYNINKYTTTDGKIVLEASDDAATTVYGDDWRTPTTEEMRNLLSNTTNAWVTDYQGTGVAGRLFTDSTDSSKTLFFPACGRCSSGTNFGVGTSGEYWSSSRNNSNTYQYAFELSFDQYSCSANTGIGRSFGYSIRGVSNTAGEIVPEKEKIYIDTNTNNIYRWDGSEYIQLASDIIEGYYKEGFPSGQFFSTPPEYVYIGGLYWAIKNVGANDEHDIGLYFQWGDTQGYTADQVGEGDGQKYFGWKDYKYSNEDGSVMTKYNETDGKTVLDPEDDAATVNMGSSWRMPTKDDFDALLNATNKYDTLPVIGSPDVAGKLFVDKNSQERALFFPKCGECYEGSIDGVGEWSNYLSSSISGANIQREHILYLASASCFTDTMPRNIGLPVRGVSDTEPEDNRTPIAPQTGKIYIDISIPDPQMYIWNGLRYVQINAGSSGDLSNYYTKSEVDAALENKADNATTLSGYGITDAYTKTEIDNKIGDIETLLSKI